MTSMGNRCFGLAAGLLFISLLAGGCHREATPETKQARLIAAENMQLQKSLTDRDTEMDRLRTEHARALKQKEDELTACRARIENLERDLQKGIAERVNSVTAAVMAENARLRQEIEQLKAQLSDAP